MRFAKCNSHLEIHNNLYAFLKYDVFVNYKFDTLTVY